MTRKIPARFIRIAPQKPTVATQNTKTGYFTGRKVVRVRGDKTYSRYLIKNYDANHDGKIQGNEHGGTIQGRTINPKSESQRRVRVHASRRARGYERRI
jgi:hypothetical protein